MMLALCLALATAPAAAAPAAESGMLGLREELHLGADSGFAAHQSFINEQGRAVVRLHQLYQGRRVWAGEAIAHLEPGGAAHFLSGGVQQGIALPAGTRLLEEEQATEIALRDLAPRGPVQSARAELVVFPTRFAGDLVGAGEAVKAGPVRPAAPYVWAWQIRTLLTNLQDGHLELSYIVDASTGVILRRWSELKSATAAAGTGHSYYRGTVPLSTTQASDGSYSLNASDRGALPQPFLASQGITQVGLTTYTGALDVKYAAVGFQPYSGHATDDWGNGAVNQSAWNFSIGKLLLDYTADHSTAFPRNALAPSGETSAVDAHYGLSVTWDFYKNVFGRDGLDGLGTSLFAIVHTLAGRTPASAQPLTDSLYWSSGYYGLAIGDGSYPALPTGNYALTELDLIAHEATHGVIDSSAGFFSTAQSGALSEGTADLFGKMVEAYADGGAQGGSIPEFPPGDLSNWQVARHSNPGGAIRFMYQPSLDGVSPNEWFDGLDDLDIHFSSGPVNRFFYFLAQGASPAAIDPTHSVYLPHGLTGIGNEKAARIWYKALTEQLAPDADFLAARAASATAARELYGAGSAEETAVLEAWAAVNVGPPPGQPDRVRVSFPVVHPPGSFLDTHAYPPGVLAKVRFYPTRANVHLRCDVNNAADPGVTWDVIWPAFGNPVGVVNADGSWTTPEFEFYADLLTVTATSKADPTQYAKGKVLLVNLDADTDGETDAVDLGAVAMAWGLPVPPHAAAALAGLYSVSDWDLVYFDEAFLNGWPVKQ